MTFEVLPVLLKDGYKVGHVFQYPEDTTLVYSNFTARASRVEGSEAVMMFGLQYFVEEYLKRQFEINFFARPKDLVLDEYSRRIDNYLGPGVKTDHIAALHDLGYLPLRIKAVPEGTLVPMRVPVLTIVNTHQDFFWLTNMLETLMSNILWMPMTSATTAFRYRKNFELGAERTGGAKEFVPWQGHDFSFRGLPGVEAACMSGAAHLLSFTGTDTIPAIDFLENYYGANAEVELVGGSVPATEHSVMSVSGVDDEQGTYRRLLEETYPAGIVSIVSDTWDLWKVVTEILPALHETVTGREGKLVVRPDSGDPVKIICGDLDAPADTNERKGVVRLLWDEFGGTETEKGFKVLDQHVGVIYGDSISLERQRAILSGLEAIGFATSNVVLGIGSYTYQHVTRDTYGFAMKATYAETRSRGGLNIFKDPVTDSGVKKSATGLLRVDRVDGVPTLREKVDWSAENGGMLETVFEDGQVKRFQTLAEIRAIVEGQL